MCRHRGWSLLLLPVIASGAAAAIGPAVPPLASQPPVATTASAASDLDAFMARVLATRDENWRKLQQYVLDERERADLTGPGGERLFGILREYTWYIRDGVFVRSPLRFDGVTVSDEERLTYERRWMEREREREAFRARRRAGRADRPDSPATPGPVVDTSRDTLARLTQEPRFVSGAYFLRFEFEAGHYALAGRETFDGLDVLRIEYYPSRLFKDDDDGDRDQDVGSARDREEESRITRQMNKVALVTLWIEPQAHQIVRYTFENTDLGFLPGRSLVRLDDLRATMTMGQPFPGVWLPRTIDAHGALTLATGTYVLRYSIHYADYREADVKVRLR